MGEGPAQDPGWCESAIQRSLHRQKRCSGRGTGAVRATGSYEGSPADGRHSGSSRGVSGHAGRSRVVSALSSDLRPVLLRQKPRTRPGCSPREGEGGVGSTRARQGCQRLDRIHAVGRQRPRSRRSRQAPRREASARMPIRRSGRGRRETSGPPVMPYGAQDSVGRPRRASGVSEPGTHEVRVHVVRLGGRYRSDASRVFLAKRSQDLVARQGR
jgi:hypothetical protein